MLHLAIIGFGNVAREFVRLLQAKREQLALDYRITGIASRRLGFIVDSGGLAEDALLHGRFPQAYAGNIGDWLRLAGADVLFECTTLEPRSGQPAIDHLRAALEHGAHAISANKGPVVHGYEELTALARQRGRRFLFESSVMDGIPVFNLFRECLPGVELRGIRGVLNSTTNVILDEMARGASFEEGVRSAQEIGVAEADPSNDVDGWDAAVKLVALARVLMRSGIRLEDVERQGIRGVSAAEIRAAQDRGCIYRLVAHAQIREGRLVASVRPEALPLSDALAQVRGTSSALYLQTDICPEIGIVETGPGLVTTAYGLVTDLIAAVRDAVE